MVLICINGVAAGLRVSYVYAINPFSSDYVGKESSEQKPADGAFHRFIIGVASHCHRRHPEQLIVSRNVEGGTTISNYADLQYRTKLLTLALQAMGVK